MKYLLILMFGSVACWDAVTTYIGAMAILNSRSFAMPASIIITIATTAFALSTKYIFADPTTTGWKLPRGSGIIFIPLWLLAICFNIYTSFIANSQVLILNQEVIITDFQVLAMSMGQIEIWFALGITLLVSGSSLLVSLFLS